MRNKNKKKSSFKLNKKKPKVKVNQNKETPNAAVCSSVTISDLNK
jgi:hypothetical protein